MTAEPNSLRLHTTLEPCGPAAAIVLTDDQAAAFGAGKAFPVRVTIGVTTVPARLSRMGGENLVGLSKALRAELNVEIGQVVDVVVALDAAPREVEVPPALATALAADPAAKTVFDAMAPSHRKEFARWVAEAKREETRATRVEKAVEMLHAGQTR